VSERFLSPFQHGEPSIHVIHGALER
jgi:hypothetical protein